MSLTYLAAEGGSEGLFGALGVDLRSLILNGLAFLVIVWLFGKFLYPPLTRALDKKRDELTAAAEAGDQAKVRLTDAGRQADQLTGEARAAADQLLADARREAESLIATARTKADAEAARILASAHEQLDRDVSAAREQLRRETTRLVARATEAVAGEKIDPVRDAELVRRGLEAAR